MSKITVIFSDDQTKKLSGRTDIVRGGISETIREAIDRYMALLEAGQHTLRGKLSSAEMSLLVDISSGSMYNSQVISATLACHAQDADESYYTTHGVDRNRLVNILANLCPAETAALIDAIERYWIASGAGFTPDIDQLI